MPINLDSYNTKVDEIKSTMAEASEQPAKNSAAKIIRIFKESMQIYNSLADTYFAVKTWVDGQLLALSNQVTALTDSVSDTNNAIDAVEIQIDGLETNVNGFLGALDSKSNVLTTYTKVEVDDLITTSTVKPTVFSNVGSQSAMLALNAIKGDFAIRTDITQTFILANEPATLLANWVQIETTAASDSSKQSISEKNQANGYAGLDGSGKISANALPTSVMEYKGIWNASTNSPSLADGIGDTGDIYVVSVGGVRNLGSGNITFVAGDWVTYNGTIWQLNNASATVIPEIITFKQVNETRQQFTIANGTAVNIDFSLGTYVEINITSSVAINLTFSGSTGKYGFAVLKITGNAQNINLPVGTTQPDVDGYSAVNLIVPRTKAGTQRLTVDYANDTYYISPSSTI